MKVKENTQLTMRLSDNKSTDFAWYSSYETFGAVDGPGIRLVFFLQGCPLRCLFCHNPETTPFGTKDKKITINEIVELYKRNETFYGNKNAHHDDQFYGRTLGGVTMSGGESMAQYEFIIALFEKLQSLGVHTTLDTAAGPLELIPPAKLKRLLEVTDIFLIDIKHPDDEVSIRLTGENSKNQLGLIKICEETKTHYWIRHDFVPSYSDAKDEYMVNLGRIIGNLKYMDKFEILPYHSGAISKYDDLGWSYQLRHIKPPSAEMIKKGMLLIQKGIEIVRKDPSKSLL